MNSQRRNLLLTLSASLMGFLSTRAFATARPKSSTQAKTRPG